MQKTKLMEARRNRGYSQEYMANALKMDVSNYSRRESGQIKILPEQWQQIAKELQVPVESIYETDENLIFIFKDNATGNGNIVTNYSLPQDVLELYKKHISVLEQEISYLKDLLNKGQTA
ncbi:MAG: helix-turn-helix transcriptional regulator [Paludibacter sp.]|nr:helix-turn-helix transcriptional regulator [Paludibacter sp.]